MDGIVDRGVDIDTTSRYLGHGGLVRPMRIVPTLIAAWLIASTSCSDTVAPTWPRNLAAPATPLTTLHGVAQLAPTNPNEFIGGVSDGGQPSALGMNSR